MKKRILAAPLAVALAVVGMTAAPAQASSKCSDVQSKRVALPNKSDLDLNVFLCVQRYPDDTVYGELHISWSAATLPGAFGKKFDGFKVTSRLESRTSSGGTDSVSRTHTCDYTASANDKWAATAVCKSGNAGWNGSKWWSGDGTVQWDIDGDGKGWQTAWQLTGSPLLT